MAKHHLSYFGCALLAAILSFPSYAISIEQAWKQAKQSDPDYEKAKIGVQIGETGVASSRSSLLPSLSATASSNWNEDSDNTNTYGATLSQTIWDSSLWSDLDEAQANYLRTELELSQAHNELAQKLLATYLDVASAQGDLLLANHCVTWSSSSTSSLLLSTSFSTSPSTPLSASPSMSPSSFTSTSKSASALTST